MVLTDELAVGPLGWLVDSDEVARVLVTDELARAIGSSPASQAMAGPLS